MWASRIPSAIQQEPSALWSIHAILDFNTLVCCMDTMHLKYLRLLLWKIHSILFHAFHTMASAARMPILHVGNQAQPKRYASAMPNVSAGKGVILRWLSILPNTSSVKKGRGRSGDS